MSDTQDQIRSNKSQTAAIRFRCLGGGPAPPAVLEGLSRLLSFPEATLTGFWDVLTPILREPGNPRNRGPVDAFCRDHGLSEQDMAAAMGSCDLLFRQAAAQNLPGEAVRQDLESLPDGRSEAAALISSRYDALKAGLRAAVIQESLADHGKLMIGLDWRVDTVSASDRGTELNTSVIFLTLRYRDGKQVDRITLQLTPEALTQLKQFTDRLARPAQT